MNTWGVVVFPGAVVRNHHNRSYKSKIQIFVDQKIVCTEKKIFKSNMPISRTAAIIKEHYIIYAHLWTEFGKIIVIKKR